MTSQTWQSDPDIEGIRQAVNNQIYTLFQKRKPGGPNQWSEKLPDFVKRLEAALFNSANTKEEYSDFGTLEARLQDVARRLVHRPPSTPSSTVQSGAGVLSNGAFDSSNPQQQSAGVQQAGMQAGAAPNPAQLMANSAQGMEQPGMVPTPNAAAGVADAVSVKPELAGTPPNGMPMGVGAAAGAAAGGGAAEGGSSGYPGPASAAMVPSSAGQNAMTSTLMSNGAPVLIKQDNWSNLSPGMVPTSGGSGGGAGGGRIGDALVNGGGGGGGMLSSSGPTGFMPTSAAGGSSGMMMMPNSSGGGMPGGGSGMITSPALGGMMPNPGGPSSMGGMVPNGPGGAMGGGMVPSSMGMAAMVPNPGSMGGGAMGGGMVPSSMGMVPSPVAAAAAVLPNGGMYPQGGGMGGLSSPPMQQLPQMLPQMLPQQQEPGQQLQQQQAGAMQLQQQAQQQQQQQAAIPVGMVPITSGAMGRGSSPGLAGFSLADAPDGSQQGGEVQQGGGGPGAAAAAGGMPQQQAGQQQLQQQGGGFPQQQQGQEQQGQGAQQQQQQPGGAGGVDNAQKSMADRQQYIQKQQRWLLFLRHCAKCQQSEEDCQFSRSCRVGKELWTHILGCNNPQCPYPRCTSSKDLLKHHQKCQNTACPICTPVKEYVRRTRAQGGAPGMSPSMGGTSAQPCSSVTSAPPPGGQQPQLQDFSAMQHQQQQQHSAGGLQQQQQGSGGGMLGMKRSASSLMDPAAAAAMPAGMMQMPGAGGPGMMGGMMPTQQQQQQQQQQAAMGYAGMGYGQQAGYMQQPYGGPMQAGYPQQMQFPRQAMQQQYGQQMGLQPYGQQGGYMQQPQPGMGYGPGSGMMQQQQQQPGGMGGMVPTGGMMQGNGGMMPMNGMVPQHQHQQQPQQPQQQHQQAQQLQQQHGMAAAGADEQTSKRAKPEADKMALLCKNTGTSLLECFEALDIKTHVESVYATAQATKTPAQAPVNPGDECKVCGLTKLTYEPPCIYCTQCGQRIKRGQTYHCTVPEPGCEFRGFWCHGCLLEHKSDRIPWEGSQSGVVYKKDLQKKKNDDEIEEGWVQCDCCESWVHMICGLFNKGKNNQNVHYLCPSCLVMGLEYGKRERIQVRPQAMLEGKDLPPNALSLLLEQRLHTMLAQERQQRAMMQNKPLHEVPTAEGLTVRVINNVIKKCEVKPKFYEAFRGDGYPEAFIYRQRVVLLFQKIDGVDVALYCMYVQEYGADCPAPNRNAVYLSYIDSVKYFRPELQASTGVSLRTFVYHQILLGYLAFVRGLGFEQMYIWACPPLAGDDYILYCHPSRQKTPRSDRLRSWYHDMLRKARDEGTVAHVTTLWDSFFEGGRDHRYDKPSVTHIPYLEGDYWPGEAENLLAAIQDGQRSTTSGGNTALSRKAGGSKGKRYGAGPATTDEALLSRLGDILGGNMKEDFMVVHLQEPCSFCRRHVQGGVLHRYIPNGAAGSSALARPPPERRFEGIRLESPGPVAPSGPLAHLQICEQCYSTEVTRVASGAKSRLPGGLSLSDLTQQMVAPLQLSVDTDPDMGSEFFETRQAFLSLCQGNHYQFDSLRRAKHSSMMVLYHLHNPEAPAFSSTCNFCNVEIEPGTGLRCTVCSDFDMCKNCQANGMRHDHPMVATTDFAKRDEMRMRLTEQERIERNQQLQKTLTLLVHACSCHDLQCSSTSCRKVRQLFQHAVACQQKVTGGCHLCKKMWCLLNLHAKSCTTSNCPVPRCRELKELRRRQQAHLEQKRRSAYANMMRNATSNK